MKFQKFTPIVNLLTIFLILSLAFIWQCSNQPPEDPNYISQISEWHKKRISSLQKPDSWLSLAGLYWLKEGENRFGDDPSNDIVFPADKAAPFMGSFYLKDTSISINIAPGIEVKHKDNPIQMMILKSDAEQEPSLLTHGTLNWYIIKRGEKYGIRLKDSENPNLLSFEGIDTYPIKGSWRVEAQFEPYHPPKKIAVPTVLGTISESPCPGALLFSVGGETFRLDPIAPDEKSSFFVIFGDETNGKETYGAGRFLSVDLPDENGKTIIDFNKAYNPPCTFSPYATCPLPPEQNLLSLKVTAGEKMYVLHH
jgi:uncharacterized protein (DUF1684 family)